MSVRGSGHGGGWGLRVGSNHGVGAEGVGYAGTGRGRKDRAGYVLTNEGESICEDLSDPTPLPILVFAVIHVAVGVTAGRSENGGVGFGNEDVGVLIRALVDQVHPIDVHVA
jgi:hypothetical protein